MSISLETIIKKTINDLDEKKEVKEAFYTIFITNEPELEGLIKAYLAKDLTLAEFEIEIEKDKEITENDFFSFEVINNKEKVSELVDEIYNKILDKVNIRF